VVAQYGKDLQLSNFTGAEMRSTQLKGANLTGAYLMKAWRASVRRGLGSRV